MTKKILSVIVLLALTSTCSSPGNSHSKINFNKIFLPKISDFNRLTDIKTLPEDSMANYLGEAAEDYIDYGVIQAGNAEYGKNSTIYSVDIFQFTNRLGAFGIYARKRLADDTFISVGTESLIRAGYIYYFKDRFFMTVNSYGVELPDLESLRNFAAAIDSLLPGAELFPLQLDIFPDKRLIAHSQKFWPHGFDNYSVPESCFSADYLRRGQTCRLFYAERRTNVEYDTFVKLIQKKGRILTHMADIGKNSIYAITDEDGKILVGFSDGIIYGVMNVSNDYWAKALCEALLENMGKKL